MKNKDEFYQLFRNGCPPPKDSRSFRTKTLERIGTEARARRRFHPWKGLCGFLMSPLPLILCAGVLLLVFRDKVFAFMNVRQDVGVIIGICVCAAFFLNSCITMLLNDTKDIDIVQLTNDLRDTA